jgi:3-phosphoshikimate 1-carboxyvinyltransferase
MVADFGARVDWSPDAFFVHPIARYVPRTYSIEPDASSASYAFAVAAATGGTVTVPDLGRDALQGDYHFVDLLERAGATVERGDSETTVRGDALQGVDADMHHISDTVMTMAALAVLADGPTTIRNVANIRIKETDRLAATVTELARLGQTVTHGDDWLRIEPGPVRPAVVHCYGDHRIAMSFAVLGLARPGITIEDPACVAKTYPTFWGDIAACYRAAGEEPPF